MAITSGRLRQRTEFVTIGLVAVKNLVGVTIWATLEQMTRMAIAVVVRGSIAARIFGTMNHAYSVVDRVRYFGLMARSQR